MTEQKREGACMRQHAWGKGLALQVMGKRSVLSLAGFISSISFQGKNKGSRIWRKEKKTRNKSKA